MSQSDLGIDLTRRNVYILDARGQVLDSSNQADSVSVTTNILEAMNGQVGQRGSIASSIMDLAVPSTAAAAAISSMCWTTKDTVNA